MCDIFSPVSFLCVGAERKICIRSTDYIAVLYPLGLFLLIYIYIYIYIYTSVETTVIFVFDVCFK